MILLDTDVILDVALAREPHVEASAALLHLLEVRHRRAFVAWHTLSNLWYLLRPRRGREPVRRFLEELTALAAVAPAGTDDFLWAVSLPMTDLEDAMQVAAARACGAEHIATRNVADFQASPVPARTPAELLDVLG